MTYRQRINSFQTKERMNFGEILFENERDIKQFLDVIHDPDQLEYKAFCRWFIHALPDDWKDERWNVELLKAKKRVAWDIRPEICGYKASKEFCQSHGIPIYEIEETDDPDLQHQAIMNLLYRRGVIARNKWLELSTGRKFNQDNPDSVEISDEEILGDINPE